jgi:hypothetical protein
MTKAKEGRDYVELSNVIASVQDDKIRISDMGSTLTLTVADWKKLQKFVDAKIKELK